MTGRSENDLNGVAEPHISNSFTVGTKTLRLDTPGAVWKAGCCVWMETGKPKAESFAVISNNHCDKAKLYQKPMKVTGLETHLYVFHVMSSMTCDVIKKRIVNFLSGWTLNESQETFAGYSFFRGCLSAVSSPLFSRAP